MYKPLRSPATKLADTNLLFEIAPLFDLIREPTTRPATITGIMTEICGMELAQYFPSGCYTPIYMLVDRCARAT